VFKGVLSALSALWIAGFASPADAGAQRVVEALFACDISFFEVFASERAAFSPKEVRISHFAEQRIEIVKFDPPVEAFGLRLTGYQQEIGFYYGPRPTSFEWGFQVDETPAGAALALRHHFPEGFEGSDETLMALKFPTQTHRNFSVSKPRLAGETGANLQCSVSRENLGNIWTLPDVVNQFSEEWDTKGRWWARAIDWFIE
jgi:hypothetical protein